MSGKKVCVVGCGAAGLSSARRASSEGFRVTVYERSHQLGGTWCYTPQTGVDKYGIPIHSSMYTNLRTNLPKEVMGFPDFPIPEQEESYLPSEEIVRFLESYAEHFNLMKLIKFEHFVKNIEPRGDRWLVSYVNLIEGRPGSEEFDAVMICNGHYHTPSVPPLLGVETFSGEQMHSHDYREASPFREKRVVVVGAGPSGIDLSTEISSTASKVTLSHQATVEIKGTLPLNVALHPEIAEINGSTVTYRDGCSEEIDVIFYCTGYKYSFPFLSPDCGIQVKDNYVEPLYLHLFNVERPSMCFIGLPFYVCAFSMFDLQAQVVVKTLKGEVELPSREEMEWDRRGEEALRNRLGLKRKLFHMMGPMQGQYYDRLAKFGRIDSLPPVFTELHNEASRRQLEDHTTFRQDRYALVDSRTFVKLN